MALNVSRLLRRLAPSGVPDGWRRALAPAGTVMALAGLEFAARRSKHEGHDLVVLAGLLALGYGVVRLHHRDPRPWTEWLAARLARLRAWVTAIDYDLGIDLRGEPPFPKRSPRSLTLMVAVPCLLAIAAFAVAPAPDVLRGVAGTIAALPTVALMGLAWVFCPVAAILLMTGTSLQIHNELVWRHAAPRPRSLMRESTLIFVAGVAVVAAWAFAPLSWGLILLVATVAATSFVLLLPGVPDLVVLWRPAGSRDPVRATGWRWLVAASMLAVVGAVLLPVGVVHGAFLRGVAVDPVEAFPMSARLSAGLVWAAVPALLLFGADQMLFALDGRRLERLRRRGPGVALRSAAAAPRRELRARLRAAGFRPRAEGRAREALLAAEVRDDGALIVDGGAVVVPPGGLPGEEWSWRVHRRHEIRCRRHLVRGLHRAFKVAARLDFQAGTGCWVAPHLVWARSLSRDQQEPYPPDGGRWTTRGEEMIGPAWTELIPAEALAHLARMLDDLELDLIFVEDGVDFRRFRRVLRLLFETWDMLGGRQRAEEVHLVGLPGVRCLILDFDMRKPYEGLAEGYPEPGFEDIGRARVLYVFRDRGGDETPIRDPSDVRGEPLLV